MTEITLLSPQTYNGHFSTISWVEDRGWQLTEWAWGQPIGHTVYQSIFEALMDGLNTGLTLASKTVRQMFEEDVVAGDMA